MVGLLHLWGELVDQVDACRDQLGSVRGEVSVPHVEGVEHTAVAAMAGGAGRFQQCGALPQHFVVVRSHRADPRSSCRGQFVEVATAFAGIPAYQRQVLWREQHRPQHPQYLAGRADGGAVQPRLVGAAGRDFEVDGELAAVVHHDRRDHRTLGARPDQRRVRCDAVRAEGRRIPKGFNEIRLTEAVGTNKHRPPRFQIQVGPRPGSEVLQSQAADVHFILLLACAATYPDSLTRLTAWPPNWLRRAATAFMVGDSSWRDKKRANSDAAMPGTGTRSRIASSTVHRPSPESSV